MQSHKPRADLKKNNRKTVEMQSCIRNRYFFYIVDTGTFYVFEVQHSCMHSCIPLAFLSTVNLFPRKWSVLPIQSHKPRADRNPHGEVKP